MYKIVASLSLPPRRDTTLRGAAFVTSEQDQYQKLYYIENNRGLTMEESRLRRSSVHETIDLVRAMRFVIHEPPTLIEDLTDLPEAVQLYEDEHYRQLSLRWTEQYL